MKTNNPTARGGAVEKLAGEFHVPFTLDSYRTQLIASRYALPIETAAIMAALAFGGAAHV